MIYSFWKHKLLASCIVMYHAYNPVLKAGCGSKVEIWEFGYDLRDHVFDPLCITFLSVVLKPNSARQLNIHAFGQVCQVNEIP